METNKYIYINENSISRELCKDIINLFELEEDKYIGKTRNGVVDTANYGGISYYTQEAPGLAQKIARPFTGNGGGGGSRLTIGDPGGAGTHGFCRIYFLYNP